MGAKSPALGVAGTLLIPAAGFAIAEGTFSGVVWPFLLGLGLLVLGVALLARFVFAPPERAGDRPT